jgi:predicted DCC family thiol-disulfide oxidoreductase YuxK
MNLPINKKIILFDGVCNLCNSFVQFVIKHDKKDVFRFVALQSDFGIEIIKNIGLENQNIDSVVLYIPKCTFYIKSNAALEICKNLNGIFKLAVVLKVFPRFFRDFVYDFIARNRYRWLGKKESCMIPTPELKNKFLA